MSHFAVTQRTGGGWVVQRVSKKGRHSFRHLPPIAGPFAKKCEAQAMKKTVDYRPDLAPIEVRILRMFSLWNVGRSVGDIARALRGDDPDVLCEDRSAPLTTTERKRARAAVAVLLLEGRLERSEALTRHERRCGFERFRMVDRFGDTP